MTPQHFSSASSSSASPPAIDGVRGSSTDPLRILIIGGGFAGVQCAKRLRRHWPASRCEIVLFAQENSMVFYPLLAEVVGATISPAVVSVPLRQMLPGVRCRTEEIRQVDPAASSVEYEGEDGRVKRMPYDHVVIACGSVVLLDLVPGMADHAFPLKSVGDAIALRFHVMQQLEKAEVCDDPERRRWYLSVVVVGGGFSGVEVAGEINDLFVSSAKFYKNFTPQDFRITLVQAGEEILPEVSEPLRGFAREKMEADGIRVLTNQRVRSASAEGVTLDDDAVITAATIVCTIGTTMPQLVRRLNVPKDRGRVLTDPDLRVRGLARVWAIGDCAQVINAYDQRPSPTTGQFAEREGRQAAENIVRAVNGTLTRPFAYRPLGQLCGIGGRKAVADIAGLHLSGFFAWWLWRTVYLLKTPTWSRRIKLAFDWTWELIFPRDLAHPRVTQTDRIARARFLPGDVIFRQGETATHFYMIEKGEVEVVRYDADGGAPRTLGILRAGEFFGEVALLDNMPRSAEARARTAVDAMVMGKEMFSRLSHSLTPFRTLLTQALQWRRPRLNPRLSAMWDRLALEPLATFLDPMPAARLSPDDPYSRAVCLFDELAVEQLPVLDVEQTYLGIVTRSELFEAFAKGMSPGTAVREMMRTTLMPITNAQSSLAVAEMMHALDMDWLPVVDDPAARRMIGVVRSERMLRYILSQSVEEPVSGLDERS